MNTAESYMTCRRQLDAAGNSMTSGPTEATLALLRSLVDNVRYLLAQAEAKSRRVRRGKRGGLRPGRRYEFASAYPH